MGVVQRQSIKSSIVVYVGVIFGFVIQIILFPSFFTAEQVGLIAFILASANILAAFVQFGIPSTIVRYRQKVKEDGTENRFFWYSISVPVIIFAVLCALFFGFKGGNLLHEISDNVSAGHYYSFIALFTLLIAFFGVLSAHSRSFLRIVVPNILEKVVIRALLVALVILYVLNVFDFQQFMIGYVLIYVLLLIAIIIYVNRLHPVGLGKMEPQLGSQSIRSMLTFGGLSFLSTMGDQVVNNIDVIMVTRFLDLEAAGIYKTTYYMGAIIALPMNSLGQIASPIYANAWHNNDTDKVEEMYKKSSINLSIIGLLLFTLVYINVDNIFSMMPKNGEIYRIGRNVVVLIALGKFFSMVLGLNSHLIANSKYYYVNLVSVLFLAGLTIGTNYLFIPDYGIVGAAFASVLSLIVYNLMKLLYIRVQFKMHPFSSKTITVLLLGAALIGLNYLLPKLTNVYVDSAYRSILILLVFTVCIYWLKASQEVNKMADKFLIRGKSQKQ